MFFVDFVTERHLFSDDYIICLYNQDANLKNKKILKVASLFDHGKVQSRWISWFGICRIL